MTSFPKVLKIGSKEFFLTETKDELSGLNPKKFYIDPETEEIYIAKVEKTRTIEAIFQDSVKFPIKEKERLQSHVDSLRMGATAAGVISANIAKALFPTLLCVPENYLTCFEDGTPVILSKILPKEIQFEEFLSNKEVIKKKKPKTPKDWEQLISREQLNLTEEEAEVLGTIYYIALFMGHWDILNNINLSNSGSVKINNTLTSCIVDWGNCGPHGGFGGLSQDSTSFYNPDFFKSEIEKPKKNNIDELMGFKGAVPFDKEVLPLLPRQLASDLFNLTDNDSISKAMLKGFVKAHSEAKINFNKKLVKDTIKKTFKESLDSKYIDQFQESLNQEAYIGHSEYSIDKILKGRLYSLDHIIKDIEEGLSMEEITKKQLEKIIDSQQINGQQESKESSTFNLKSKL
jgi:hypothetical protein